MTLPSLFFHFQTATVNNNNNDAWQYRPLSGRVLGRKARYGEEWFQEKPNEGQNEGTVGK